MNSRGEPSLWRPVLPADLAQRALHVAEEIASEARAVPAVPAPLETVSRDGRIPSLAGGDSGLALFFAYLDQALPGKGYGDAAVELLDRAVEAAGEVFMIPSLYSGFSGVAWALEHLRGRLFEEEEGEDTGEETAAALAQLLGQSPWRNDYDLISGLAGFGVYALERRPRPGGDECLRRVVALLSETAETLPEGVTWKTPPSPADLERDPEDNYNLGVAHGVPGVIALLAGAAAAGVAEARPLLDGAISWLLAQKLPPGLDSVFSYSVRPGKEPVLARLAWCYGDLGIAASLFAAARAVGEERWEQEALALARFCARRPFETTGVVDATLCHGTAGNAHLFNRLYQATGEETFAEAVRFWIERTLERHHPGEGIGGFQMRLPGPKDTEVITWRGEPGFLTGSAGVGLALLSAATPVEPAWDRVLLVSLS